MTAHTPGPWEYVPMLTASENHKGYFVRAEKAARNGKWALATVQPGDEDGKLGEANARLIAAAPELLEALQKAYLYINGGPGYTPENRMAAYHAARAAIAKATGEKA